MLAFNIGKQESIECLQHIAVTDSKGIIYIFDLSNQLVLITKIFKTIDEII